MTKVYHIVRGRKHIACVEVYTEGSVGNICVERPHESPTWFDWWSYEQRSTARRMADRFIRNNFGENASTRLVYME